MERSLSLSTIAILLTYSVVLAGGQVLFKYAALRLRPRRGWPTMSWP